MPKGGARLQSGPPPNPQSRKQSSSTHAGAWTFLPSDGRHGEPPTWPLPGQSDREAELWLSLWTKPQAIMWERMQQDHEVALYVRRLAEVELPNASTNLGTLVRQMSDALGLTVPAMLRLRWRIAEDEVAEKRTERVAPVKSSRRLKVAGDDAVAGR